VFIEHQLDVIPRPRCNLNNVMEPERPENTNSLEISWIIIVWTVEKCSSSSDTSCLRSPILSSRSLTTNPNKRPSCEQNLKRQQTKHEYKLCSFNVSLIITCKVLDRPTRSFSRPRHCPGPELLGKHFERSPR